MTFTEVKSLFEQVKARNPEAANLTLEEFARLGARSTGDPEMARIGEASPWENIIRTANQKLNEGISAITPDETLGQAIGGLAEMVGVNREVGEQVGRSLPRQVLNVGAMAVPVVGPALSFGLSAADTFDQTGSLWQTAIAGAAPMVVGKAMTAGGNAALQAAAKSPALQRLGVTGGREVIKDVTGEAAKFLPIGTKTVDTVIDQLPDKLVRFAGAELAGQATGLGLDVAAQGTEAVFNKDYLFANLLGNLAFAPLNIGDFVGTKTIESGRVILPPDPGPVRTPAEQRAFEFDSLINSLNPIEQQKAQTSAGFDIAAQVLGERRLTQINKDFDDNLSKERALLENDWNALKVSEPALQNIELQSALDEPKQLDMLTPGAKERIERFQLKLKELEGVKKARLNELGRVGSTQTLLGVTLDDLRLPETLLQKDAASRTIDDYRSALAGKVSDRGQEVMFVMHKLLAGKEEELMSGPHKEMAEEVRKVLRGEKTKFANDRSFVSLALWTTGKRPLSDAEVKVKVDKKLKEGKTTQEAVVEVNQEQLARVNGEAAQAALLAKVTPGKKRGRPEGLSKATLEKIEAGEKRIENGLASDNSTNVDFYSKLQSLISEIDEADSAIYSKLMAEVDRQVGMTFDKGLPGDRALDMIRAKLNQVKVAYVKDQVKKGKAADQNEEAIEVAADSTAQGSTAIDELEILRNSLGLDPLSSGTINDWALRLMEGGLNKNVVKALQDNIDMPIIKELLKTMNKLKVPALFDNGKLKPQYTEFVTFLHDVMKKGTPELKKEAVLFELENMSLADQNKTWLLYQQWKKDGKPAVDSIVGLNFAKSESANPLSVSLIHDMMSFDDWTDLLLSREGFDPDEKQGLRDTFAAVVDFFKSPEVQFGKMTTEGSDLKFARLAPQAYAAAATRTRDIFFAPSSLTGKNFTLQQASLLAHEQSHILFSKARSGAFGPEAQQKVQDFENWVKSISPHEAETFTDVLSDVWLGKEWKELPGVGDVIKNIRNEDGKVDSEEVMANVFGAFAAGMSRPRNPTKFYTMLPSVVRDVFDWVMRNVQGMTNAARIYYGLGGNSKQVAQAKKVKEVFDIVRRGARNAERNLADLAELANLRGEDVLDKVDLMYAKGKYGSSGKGKWKEKLSYLFDNTIMRMGSLAATYDGLQDPFMAMKDFSPLNADLTAQTFASLGMGKYSHTGLGVQKDGSWMRIRNSPELHKLASQINVEMQMLNKNLVTRGADGSLQFNMADMTPELRGKFGMFGPEAQQAVAEYFIRRAEKANPIVQGVIVSKQWESEANKLHELLFESKYADFSQQFEKSKLWSERVMKMAQNGDDAGVAAELGKITDTTARSQISDYVAAISTKIRNIQQEYQKNPNFGSLRRFQPIKVKWIKGGEVKNMQANTAEEAERMDAALKADGWTPQSVRITDFKARGSDMFDSNTKLRIRDMEERVKLALKNMAVPEEFKAELEKEIDFVGMIERTENAQSVFSTKAQRRFAEGVEDLMVLEQDMLWMSKAIYAANRNALDTKMRVALKNPKLDDYLDAKRTFAQGYENFKTQNHDWLRKLSKANASYFIGFNLPGHFAELMQPVMTHLAEMRYIGVKTGDAVGIMLGASKDLVSFYKRNMKKFAKGEEVHLWDDWQNEDEKDMLFRLKHVINASPLNYAYEDVGFEQQKLIEAAELGKKQSLTQAVSSPASAYANWGLKFYGLFTRHNAIMGLLNGYRSYRKLGLSHEEAVNKVGLFETIVNKSGGKADRQAFPFKNNAVLGHLFYGLQGYTTGWLSQLATYYRHGYKSENYEGFKNNPEAIKRARNAFKTMLLAQFGAAGVMGMPFVGAAVTLMEELTGEDIRGEMYEALDSVTGDPLLSQAASHGLSTSIAERLGIPADLHGRFAIGGMLGFNAYDGFSASSLLGPTAGMINSMWNLGKTFAQERDLQKALESGGPTGLRSIAKALDEELPLRNENALSTALGFNSTQVRKEREFTRIAEKRNEKAAREISHAARRVQEALALGSSAAQQKLRTEAMKLAESPDQLEDIIRAIGNKVKLYEEQRVMPKDIREVATPRTTAGLSELAKAMGVRLPQSQEVEREMLKQNVMRQMGMSPASRLRQAMLEDYRSEADPWGLR
jgi:hypothetical protein